MSNSNEGDKPETGKTYPIDLASKVTIKPSEGTKSSFVINTQSLRPISQPQMRVLTQVTSPVNSISTSSATQAIISTIVPQAMLKQESRGQVAAFTCSPQLTPGTALTRPTQITLATATTGSSYHVPRGPAAVANMAAPRATAIRGVTVSPQPVGTTVVRTVVPPRIPSPTVNIIPSASQWHTATTVQVQTTQSLTSTKGIVSSSLLVSQQQPRGLTATVPLIQARTQVVTRGPTLTTARPTLLQSAIAVATQASTQVHTFKPVVTVQSVTSAVSVSQVVPSSRPQTLVYSSITSGSHLSTAPRLAITNNATSQRQISNNRTLQIPTVRASTPVQPTAKLAVATNQSGILTTGARISTLPTTQENSASSTCISVSTQSANLNRFSTTTVTTQTSLPTNTTVTRLGSTVLASPTGRIAANVVSLHPVPAQINLSQARALQGQGKVITQIAHGSIQIAQVTSIGKLTTQQQSSANVPVTVVPTSRSVVNVANITGPVVNQHTASTTNAQLLTSAKVFSQGNVRTAPELSDTSSISNQSTNVFIQHGSSITNQGLRFSPMMVDQPRTGISTENSTVQSPSEQSVTTLQPISVGKQTSSPRPSILRKRDNEGSPLKVVRNLVPTLNTINTAPISPPSRPDSGGTGQSSGGSTTISATSSPGPDESPPPATINQTSLSLNRQDTGDCDDGRPIMEMSPRKKPRKQQLTGNDMHEPKLFDMQFLSEQRIKEEPIQPIIKPLSNTEVTVRKPAPVSLLNSYHQSWKSAHNHFVRYTDVKPKEDRRPSIMDIANQKRVLQKINGWKIYHLSTQIEDLSDLEIQVYEKLGNILQLIESKDPSKQDKDIDRINDLIKGNMQRSKIINDGMLESKGQVMKIFDHKVHVADIITRCASKRNFKKREKS